MMGEELSAAEVTERGLLGDRAYALVDSSDGKVASAKNLRKWSQLFDFRAAFVDLPRPGAKLPPVRITLPEGTFFDCAVVHLLTTATLDRLRELYPPGRFEVRRFRPDIVVETASGVKDFVENAWIGGTLAIGDAVRLSLTGLCPRCVITTLPQEIWRRTRVSCARQRSIITPTLASVGDRLPAGLAVGDVASRCVCIAGSERTARSDVAKVTVTLAVAPTPRAGAGSG
jgi:uncharacterized protein YcbX